MKAVDGWKVCSKCRERKMLEEFGVSSRRRDGFRDYCRACVSLCNKNRVATREARNACLKRWRAANKEKVKNTRKRVRDECPPYEVAARLGISIKYAPPELIEAKRQQILLTRAIRAFKKGMNNV